MQTMKQTCRLKMHITLTRTRKMDLYLKSFRPINNWTINPSNSHSTLDTCEHIVLISFSNCCLSGCKKDAGAGGKANFRIADAYMNIKYLIVRDKAYSHGIHFVIVDKWDKALSEALFKQINIKKQCRNLTNKTY